MSFFEALEAVFDVIEWIAGSMDIEEIVDEETSDPGIPPLVSPAKKAERYWPTTAKRTDRAPAWPPFSGHRVPLGGGT